MTAVELVVAAGNLLGEGATWDSATESLWWIDIAGSSLHRLAADGAATSWALPAKPGALAVATEHRMLVALATGFAWFGPDTGAVEHWVDPEPDAPGNRLNDGSTDRQGRFWCGSMSDREEGRTGALHRLDPDGRVTTLLTGVGIPNSIAFSPDGRTMYFAETLDRTIFRFDYDPERGTATGRREFAAVAPPGYPDGSTVDDDGCLWNAEWGGGRLVRYTPRGAIDRVVELPVSCPTSCAFGGPDRSILYVTSDSRHLGAGDREGRALDGSVLAVEAGVTGPPATPFG